MKRLKREMKRLKKQEKIFRALPRIELGPPVSETGILPLN